MQTLHYITSHYTTLHESGSANRVSPKLNLNKGESNWGSPNCRRWLNPNGIVILLFFSCIQGCILYYGKCMKMYCTICQQVLFSQQVVLKKEPFGMIRMQATRDNKRLGLKQLILRLRRAPQNFGACPKSPKILKVQVVDWQGWPIFGRSQFASLKTNPWTLFQDVLHMFKHPFSVYLSFRLEARVSWDIMVPLQ